MKQKSKKIIPIYKLIKRQNNSCPWINFLMRFFYCSLRIYIYINKMKKKKVKIWYRWGKTCQKPWTQKLLMGLYIAWRSGTSMGEIHFSKIKKIPSHPFPPVLYMLSMLTVWYIKSTACVVWACIYYLWFIFLFIKRERDPSVQIDL